MKKFPIAIQVYSVRDAASKDLRGTLQQLKSMGYDGVEFAGLYDHKPEEIKQMVEEIGLTPISAHVPLDTLLADIPGVVADYKKIGCQYIAIPWVSEERRPGGARYEETVADIAKIGEEAARQGITLLYHNHDFEFVKLNGQYGLDMLYESIPASLLQTEIDTCWVNIGGVDPAEYVLKYTGRAPLVHLKDFVGEKSENMYGLIGIADGERPKRPSNFALKPVGHGKQDFPAIIDASEKAGAQWLIVEQDNPSDDLSSLECAKLSREYLKSIGQ